VQNEHRQSLNDGEPPVGNIIPAIGKGDGPGASETAPRPGPAPAPLKSEGILDAWIEDKIVIAISPYPETAPQAAEEIRAIVKQAMLDGKLGDGLPSEMTAKAVKDLVDQLASVAPKAGPEPANVAEPTEIAPGFELMPEPEPEPEDEPIELLSNVSAPARPEFMDQLGLSREDRPQRVPVDPPARDIGVQLSLLVVSQDDQTTERISAAAKASGGVAVSSVCADLSELVTRLEKEPARAVVVDLGASPAKALTQLQPIIGQFHDSRFMVLSEFPDSQLVMTSMEAGARYFLTLASLEEDLAGYLRRLRQKETSQGDLGGMVATVLSGGGGCGATTIAVNLASEVGLISAKPVLLVDMDYDYGTVSTYLGLTGRYGIADVLAQSQDADKALVRSISLKYNDGLDVLISPASVGAETVASAPRAEQIRRAVEACKNAYSYTIIDAPRVSPEAAAALAMASAKTFIVLQPQVKDVRTSRRILHNLVHEHGVPMERLVLVANRFRQRRNALLGLSEAKEAVGDVTVECVNNDYDSAVSAINYGLPLSVAAPRSALRRDLQHLARELLAAREPAAAKRRPA